MIALSHKTKQYLLAAAKVLLLAVALGYVFYKISNTPSANYAAISNSVTSKTFLTWLLFIFLAGANWFFEILKWKACVATFKKISFSTALKQCLASLTVSLATPNRIGEYGAKALFFNSKYRKKVLLLNFYSGTIQMLVTSFFGIFGLLYCLQAFSIVFSVKNFLTTSGILVFLIALAFIFRKTEWFNGLSFSKIGTFLKTLPLKIKIKVVLFSIGRYAIFSSLFFGLLLFFGAQINILNAFLLIFAMYFLVSILPTFFVFDVVIRGSVAVWLFSFVAIPELIVLATVFAMWLLNFVFPALVGSFFVITYQPEAK